MTTTEIKRALNAGRAEVAKYKAERLGARTRVPDDEFVWRVVGDPAHGDVYQHVKTGRLYVVECIALDASDPTTRLVVYRERGAYTRVWSRPLAEFVDGRFERVL